MPWSDLDGAQQAFLRKYLKSSIWDIFSGAENAEVNQPTIERFAEFEQLDVAFVRLLGGIPGDHVEVRLLNEARGVAQGLRNDGDFDGAVDAIKVATEEVRRTIAAITLAADELRNRPKPVLVGIRPEEANQIDTLHGAIAAPLGAPVPARADLTKAQQAVLALDQGILRIQAAIDLRKQKRADFEKAFLAVKADLEKAAATDLTPLLRTSLKPDLTKAVAAADTLLQDALLAEASEDDTLHEAMTKQLGDWDATILPGLVTQASEMIRNALAGDFGKIRKDIENAIALKLKFYTKPEQEQLKPLIAALQKIKSDVETALAGSDATRQLALYDGMNDARAKLNEFKRTRDSARDARVSRETVAKGVSSSHADGVAKLRLAAPDALNAVNTVLDDANKVLGKVEVTRTLIDDRRKQQQETLEKWRLANAEHTRQEETLKPVLEQIRTLQQEVEALQELIEDLENSTEDGAAEKLVQARKDFNAKAQQGKQLLKANEIQFKALEIAERKRDELADAFNDDQAFIDAAETKKRLLDAVAFGPLSPDRTRALKPDQIKKLVDLYGKDWQLADHAATQAGSAKNPEGVLLAVDTVADRVDDGFGGAMDTTDKARAYAQNLITISGNLPTALVGFLEDYLDDGDHKLSSPEMDRGKTYEEDVKNRVQFVSKEMVQDDGTLDFDDGLNALLDVAFHPDSQRYQTPELASHMFETREWLKNTQSAQDKIQKTSAPTDKGAIALLSRGSGKDEGKITDKVAQREVVSAMMTPVFQGKVGSCFATAGVVKMRKEKPEAMLDMFIQLAEQGTFTPLKPDTGSGIEDGDPVPCVQNVPVDENALLRSLEYTIATAAALKSDSVNRSALKGCTANGVKQVKDKVKPDKWAAAETRLKTAVSGAFQFLYNPEAEIKDSNDGSSSKGRYELIAKASGKGVNSEAEFIDAVTPVVLSTLTSDDLSDKVTEEDIKTLIKSRGFLDAFLVDGKMPWELASGGRSAEATEVLTGEVPSKPVVLGKGTPTTTTVSDRSGKVLKAVVGSIIGNTEDMATVETLGMHTFNALPKDPSLGPLMKGGKAKIDENLQRELVQKGQALKDKELPVERASYMLEKELRALAGKERDEAARKALEDAIAQHKPTAPIKPAGFKALLKTATDAYLKLKSKAELETWKTETKKKTGSDPTEEDVRKKSEALKTDYDTWMDGKAANCLVQELDAPQFVLADTNWGSGQSHIFFVIAPDPTTGEAAMFQRTDPPGTLSPVKKEWVDAAWAMVD